jgi:F-type H+-transporting ATPase subunit b
MKRILFLITLLAALTFGLSAQEHAQPKPEHTQPNNVAHGAEKTMHKEAHPGEEHGAEGAAEGGHHERTYFGIPGWILKLANLIAFLGFLGYLLAKPIKKALADRRQVIGGQLTEAEARRRKSDQLATDIQARLSQIEGEVDSILQRARAEGEKQKQEIVAAAEGEAQKIMTAAQSQVDARLKAAREELTAYARQLATERAHTLIANNMTDEDRRRLFAESVQKIEGVKA